MRVLKRYEGRGAVITSTSEIEADYQIEVRGDERIRRAEGLLLDLEPDAHFELFSARGDLRLRLSTGEELAIVFLGGQVDGPARFAVNSPMPPQT